MQGVGGTTAVNRDPITIRCSEICKGQFLKGREEVHSTYISKNNKMGTLGFLSHASTCHQVSPLLRGAWKLDITMGHGQHGMHYCAV